MIGDVTNITLVKLGEDVLTDSQVISNFSNKSKMQAQRKWGGNMRHEYNVVK